MRSDLLLAELERRAILVVEIDSLSCGLVRFLDWISELPAPWMSAYFDSGSELLDWLSPERIAEAQRLVAVLPSDLHVPYDRISPQLLRHSGKLLILVGRAFRGKEDRNLKYYLRR